MNEISSSLQKTILDNFKKLNILGQTDVPEVMCSCSVFKRGIPVSTDASATPVQPPVNPIVSQFIPGEKNDGSLHVVDPGNVPFILPQGVTPDDIMMEQAAAIAPLKEAAEKKAAAAAASGATTVVTETGPDGSAVAVAIPGNTGIPSIPPLDPASITENFAPFYYEDLDYPIQSYRQSLPIDDNNYHAYSRGAQDMLGVSMSSWCVYILLLVIGYFLFIRRGRFPALL